MSSTTNLSVSDNLVVNGTTTLGDALISSSSAQFSNITANNLTLSGSLTSPNASVVCNSLNSSGTVSGQTVVSMGNINASGSLNLNGTSSNNSQIVQTSPMGNNILGNTTIQGNLNVMGNVVMSNTSQGAYSIQDGDNLNMNGAIITQQYASSQSSETGTVPATNYNLNNTLLATQFLGNLSQTTSNGSTNNSNSLQATQFNGTVNVTGTGNKIQFQGADIATIYGGLANSNTWTGSTNTFNGVTLLGNLTVNSTTISPLVLSYLSGLGGNIQNSLTALTNNFSNYGGLASSNTWTGSTNIFNGIVEIAGQYLTGNLSNGTLLFGANTTAITNQTGQNCWFSPNGMAYISGSLFTGNYNTGLGSLCGSRITSGDYNTIIGAASGSYLTTAQNDVFVGCNAGLVNTTGSSNTCIGSNSGRSVTTNSNNTFIGYGSGFNSTGSSNSFLGYLSGSNDINGSNNVYIGNQAGQLNSDTNTYSNLILIGNNVSPSVLGTNNQCVIGNSSTTTYLGGNLNVTGNTNMANLTTSGTIQCGNLNSSGTLNLTQAVVNGNLNVIGNINSNGTNISSIYAPINNPNFPALATFYGILNNSTTSSIGNLTVGNEENVSSITSTGVINSHGGFQYNGTSLNSIYGGLVSTNVWSGSNTFSQNLLSSNNNVNFNNSQITCDSASSLTVNGSLTLPTAYNIAGVNSYYQTCGVWMISKGEPWYPLVTSVSSTSMSGASQVHSGGEIAYPSCGTNEGQGCLLGSGSITFIPGATDVGYYLYPYFGVIAFNSSNTQTINVYNNNTTPQLFVPTTSQAAVKWNVYYLTNQI